MPSRERLERFIARVEENAAPIVQAVHDADGDWQFLGPVEDADTYGAKLLCFRHVIEQEPGMRILARLPVGWRALREPASTDWKLSTI